MPWKSQRITTLKESNAGTRNVLGTPTGKQNAPSRSEDQLRMGRNRATVLCVKDNHFVAVRERGVTGFSLPGGGIHYGEQPISAAIRELYEECGLQVAAIRFLTRFEGRRGLHYVFVATPRDGKVKRQASEIDSIRWVSLDEPLGAHGFQGHVIRAIETFKKHEGEING